MLIEQSKILEEYGLDKSAVFKLIHDGIDNNVHLLDASDKKYVLRESKRSEVNKNIDFEINLLLTLSQTSLSVPRTVALRDNSYYLAINNKCFTLFNYIEGHQFKTVSNEMLSANVIILGGKKLGELHDITKNIEIGIDSKRTIFTEFERLFSVPAEKLAQFDGHIEFLEHAKKFYADAKKLMQDEKTISGMIHNDYRIQNLIFSANNADASIIDFDWSCQGPFLKDIGLAIVEWSIFDFEKGPSQEAIQQFIGGYNSTGPMHIEYNAELLFWVCFSCLSDACTFFSDVLELRHKDLSINKIDQCRMYKKFKYFLKENEKYQN